jgi:uncharacterized Fe-S cluster-containing radical SAM superfamily protein
MATMSLQAPIASVVQKFTDPNVTATGENRASVPLDALRTLWINTGTLCNITCENCYIESSPSNDRLAYISRAEALAYLDEIAALKLDTAEIGFTGGEPFLNPDMLGMIEDALSRRFSVLVLTNAMQPMQRPKVKAGLLKLRDRFGSKFSLRVSLDHHTQELHEKERGPKTWAKAIAGMDWLAKHGFVTAIAGRTCWGEPADKAKAGYKALIGERGWPINVDDPHALMLFPEMDVNATVPEITTACWGILKKSPNSMMCASSRMVVKHKDAASPTVMPCTLIPYDARFAMGSTLSQSMGADGGMFDDGAVKLCHIHCAKFCVLGGGSCS